MAATAYVTCRRLSKSGLGHGLRVYTWRRADSDVGSVIVRKGCKQAAGDEGRLRRLSAWQKTGGSRARHLPAQSIDSHISNGMHLHLNLSKSTFHPLYLVKTESISILWNCLARQAANFCLTHSPHGMFYNLVSEFCSVGAAGPVLTGSDHYGPTWPSRHLKSAGT